MPSLHRVLPLSLIRQVSMRYGDIFHEPKASEMNLSISCASSVISDFIHKNTPTIVQF